VISTSREAVALLVAADRLIPAHAVSAGLCTSILDAIS
jgi:hypothetical protein